MRHEVVPARSVRLASPMVRDHDRRQVYCAEDLSAESTVLVLDRSLAELQSIANRVLKSAWWNANSLTFSPPIQVSFNRSGLRSCWVPVARRISLSLEGADLSTLCHELAHAAVTDFPTPSGAEQPDHGPHFRSLHVAIRQVVLGRRCGEDLATVYRQFGIRVESASPHSAQVAPWLDPVFAAANYEAEWRTEPGVRAVASELKNALGAIAL